MVFWLALIVFVLAVTEGLSFSFYLLVGKQYYAPQPTLKEFIADLEKQYTSDHFDRALGWVPPPKDIDSNGARISPDAAMLGPPCLSLYGDSFTFGDEVDHAAAWGNQLAKSLHCKVLNFGVSAYGTDQAYLRFVKNTSDASRVVLLGVLSENIVRNVNQNRAFIYGNEGLSVGPLKPVYFLDDSGQLQLVPVPRLTADSYNDYIEHPGRLFTKEFFIPNSSDYAKPRVSFPYVIGVIRALRYKRISDSILYLAIKNPPWFADFYNPRHPSRALEVTQNIIDHFVRTAQARSKTPVVIFLPTSRDIGNFLNSGNWTYANLYDRCLSSGYFCLNAGAAMVSALRQEQFNSSQICDYFCTNSITQSGHYNERGNLLLANVTLQYLQAHSLIK